MNADSRVFMRLAEALRPGAPPLRATDIRTAMSDLVPVKLEAEAQIDNYGLVLERIESFERELAQRLEQETTMGHAP